MTKVGGIVLLFGVAAFTTACGGAQMVLKRPLTDRCESAELDGCEDIATGLTLYADGDASTGEQRLSRGLRANAKKAAELKKFAVVLQTVGKIPGAGQYAAPLQPAVRLVLQIAEEQEQQNRQSTEGKIEPQHPTAVKEPSTLVATKADVPPQATPSEAPRERIAPPASTFWMVAGNALAEPCRFVGTPKMLCLHNSVENAAIVSDVIVSSGCPFDIVIMSHHGLDPDWAVYVPASRGADVHSATLPLLPGRKLTVGVAYKADDPQPDMRCSVSTVWRESKMEVGSDGTRMPPLRSVINALQAKSAAGKATAEDIRVLQKLCREIGDSSCSN